MIKELIEEIRFIKENSICILLILTITGILPAVICGLILKIF